eukprot:CAMPEP_0119330838 /NCGR_PEP_ID=MMETSP1333-20130426/79149_1 /TAXON_ID=418940 /ORGANISM="Scyphosphaera apsteinii, Strain RCC1455" /LENGTH=73 /DNA_ID=CAMNT_0007340305 /DNA_START=647 /DNA_END=868 /DNA_ORIENTATION=+
MLVLNLVEGYEDRQAMRGEPVFLIRKELAGGVAVPMLCRSAWHRCDVGDGVELQVVGGQAECQRDDVSQRPIA